MPPIRIRIPRMLLVVLGLMLFVSCVNPYETCACSPPPDEAVVYGRVTDPSGAVVAGALVRAERGPPGCQPSVERWEGTTSATGRYRVSVYSHGGPDADWCQRVFALPPAGSTLRGSDSVAFTVRYRPAGSQPDSVRVDLVLRAP
ncbi:MAG TPA: carboxypeptidase-like regulatory domain-containing protein [Longimicrobium sp.]|nr:carboxypeptidase-like regulatory domain-containing protein [Longimicrobium sp.]